MFYKTDTQSLAILATYNPMGNISIKASAIGEDLGNAFHTHIVEQKDPRFVYAIARAVTADVPNKNRDMFPLDEIKRAYTTFIGRNIFLDHNTKSVRNAVGKIIAAELREDEEGQTYVACLFKIDRELHPDIAHKVENGIIDSVSMGANLHHVECSRCHHLATKESEFCDHLRNLGMYSDVYSISHGVEFTELSLVSVPADPTAKMHKVFNMHNGLEKVAVSADSTNMGPLGGQEKSVEADVVEEVPQAPKETVTKETEDMVVETPVPEHGAILQIDCSSPKTADFIYNFLYPHLNNGIEELAVTNTSVKILFDKAVKDPEKFVSDAAVLFGLTVVNGQGTEKEASLLSDINKIAGKTYKVTVDASLDYPKVTFKIKKAFLNQAENELYLSGIKKALANALRVETGLLVIPTSKSSKDFEYQLKPESKEVAVDKESLPEKIKQVSSDFSDKLTEFQDISNDLDKDTYISKNFDTSNLYSKDSITLVEDLLGEFFDNKDINEFGTALNDLINTTKSPDFKKAIIDKLKLQLEANNFIDKTTQKQLLDTVDAISAGTWEPESVKKETEGTEAPLPDATTSTDIDVYNSKIQTVFDTLENATNIKTPQDFGKALVSALTALGIKNVSEVLSHNKDTITNLSNKLVGDTNGYSVAQNEASALGVKPTDTAEQSVQTETEPVTEPVEQAKDSEKSGTDTVDALYNLTYTTDRDTKGNQKLHIEFNPDFIKKNIAWLRDIKNDIANTVHAATGFRVIPTGKNIGVFDFTVEFPADIDTKEYNAVMSKIEDIVNNYSTKIKEFDSLPTEEEKQAFRSENFNTTTDFINSAVKEQLDQTTGDVESVSKPEDTKTEDNKQEQPVVPETQQEEAAKDDKKGDTTKEDVDGFQPLDPIYTNKALDILKKLNDPSLEPEMRKQLEQDYMQIPAKDRKTIEFKYKDLLTSAALWSTENAFLALKDVYNTNNTLIESAAKYEDYVNSYPAFVRKKVQEEHADDIQKLIEDFNKEARSSGVSNEDAINNNLQKFLDAPLQDLLNEQSNMSEDDWLQKYDSLKFVLAGSTDDVLKQQVLKKLNDLYDHGVTGVSGILDDLQITDPDTYSQQSSSEQGSQGQQHAEDKKDHTSKPGHKESDSETSGATHTEQQQQAKEKVEDDIKKATNAAADQLEDPADKLKGKTFKVSGKSYKIEDGKLNGTNPADLRRKLYEYVLESNGINYKEILRGNLEKKLIKEAKDYIKTAGGFLDYRSPDGVSVELVLEITREDDPQIVIRVGVVKQEAENYSYTGTLTYHSGQVLDTRGTQRDPSISIIEAIGYLDRQLEVYLQEQKTNKSSDANASTAGSNTNDTSNP